MACYRYIRTIPLRGLYQTNPFFYSLNHSPCWYCLYIVCTGIRTHFTVTITVINCNHLKWNLYVAMTKGLFSALQANNSDFERMTDGFVDSQLSNDIFLSSPSSFLIQPPPCVTVGWRQGRKNTSETMATMTHLCEWLSQYCHRHSGPYGRYVMLKRKYSKRGYRRRM